MTVRTRIPLTFVLPLLSVLALAACAAPPLAKPPAVTTVEPASYTPPPTITAPPSPGPTTMPGHPSLADLAHGPQRFEGLEGKDVLAALGEPNFSRRETPAEVWQYYGPGCILDLFLYDDRPGGAGVRKLVDGVDPDGKVAHAELRGREGELPEAGCLSRLINQRHSQRAG